MNYLTLRSVLFLYSFGTLPPRDVTIHILFISSTTLLWLLIMLPVEGFLRVWVYSNSLFHFIFSRKVEFNQSKQLLFRLKCSCFYIFRIFLISV